MKFPALETERLVLRELNANDAEDLFHLLSNKTAMKYWDVSPHENIETTKNSLHKMMAAWNNHDGVAWGIELKDSHQLIGQFSLHSPNKSKKEIQLGYLVHPMHWGNGYGSESLNVAIKYCFDKACIKTILAEVDPNNKSSVRILVKHNFKFKNFRKNDLTLNNKYYDTAVYELIKSID